MKPDPRWVLKQTVLGSLLGSLHGCHRPTMALSRLFRCPLAQDPLHHNCSCVSRFHFFLLLLYPSFLPSLSLPVCKICMCKTKFRSKRKATLVTKPERTQSLLPPVFTLNSNWKKMTSCAQALQTLQCLLVSLGEGEEGSDLGQCCGPVSLLLFLPNDLHVFLRVRGQQRQQMLRSNENNAKLQHLEFISAALTSGCSPDVNCRNQLMFG